MRTARIVLVIFALVLIVAAQDPFQFAGFMQRQVAAGCVAGTNALTVSVVGTGVNSATAQSYNTSAFTPSSNATLIAFILATDNAPIPDGESVTNTGSTQLTWWEAGSTNFNSLASPSSEITAWVTQLPQGLAPFEMTVVCNLFNSGTGVGIIVVEVTGAAQTAADGVDAVVQTTAFGADADANPTNQFAAPGNNGLNSLIFAVADDINSGADNTATLSWTEMYETNFAGPTSGLSVYYSNTVPAVVTTATNTASARDWVSLVLEIKAGTNCIAP